MIKSQWHIYDSYQIYFHMNMGRNASKKYLGIFHVYTPIYSCMLCTKCEQKSDINHFNQQQQVLMKISCPLRISRQVKQAVSSSNNNILITGFVRKLDDGAQVRQGVSCNFKRKENYRWIFVSEKSETQTHAETYL